MLAALLPGLQQVRVWNRTADGAAAMASSAPPFPVAAIADLTEALRDANAVITYTSAPAPILGPDSIRPGRIVVQAGYRKVSFDAIDRVDAVVVDMCGPFARTSAKSLFQMHRAGRFLPDRVAADLGQALQGWRPRPGSAVYVSSFGLNVFDVALAASVLRRAEALGLGKMLPLLPEAGEDP